MRKIGAAVWIGGAALAAAAGTLGAETYKWVDEKGVVNYSNAPPANAAAAKALKTVAERISVYQPDPNLGRLADVYRRLDLMEADYRQRQAYLPNYAAAAVTGCNWPNGPICDYGYRMSGYLPYTYPLFAAPAVFAGSSFPMQFTSFTSGFAPRPGTRGAAGAHSGRGR